MAVYGYARVSTATQVEDGESLGVQERQLTGWCMMHGHQIERIFVEEGVSASVPIDQRPQGKALLSILKRGDTVIVSRLDRLFRSALDALQTVERVRGKGVTIFVIDGLGDITGNGMGRAFMTIAATFAELERETIRERVKAVKNDQRQRGRYLGGKIPFGYRLEYITQDDQREACLIAEPDEQEIIVKIVALRQQDQSLRAIRNAIVADHGRALSLDTISRIAAQTIA